MLPPTPLNVLHIGDASSGQLVEAAAELQDGAVCLQHGNADESQSIPELTKRAHAREIIVLGPAAPEPLRLAQGLRQKMPLAQFIFLVPRERLTHFRRGLAFVPHMASAWTAEAEGGPQALAATLSQAAAVAQQKGQMAAISRRINQQISAKIADGPSRWQQLAISENYLATLLAQAPDGFIAISPEGTLLAWNASATRLFGASADEAIGSHFEKVFGRLEEVTKFLRASPWDGTVRDCEVSFTNSDGVLCWVECSLAPVRDPGGDIVSLSVTFRDVTQRYLAEERLRESELRYRTVTETLPQLVWTCRPNGFCDYLSRQWQVFTGRAISEQLGLGWLDLCVHPDDRARAYEHWMGALAGNHPYDIDYRLRRHDGAYRWFKTRGTPVRDEAGEIFYWFGTCTDIQEIVEARETLSRNAEELEAQVTAEVEKRNRAEDALRQAQKMEAVGQLTGGIAHDFNNILQGIIGSLGLLQRRIEQGRIAELDRLVSTATKSADRAAGLIHRLLAFSRRQPLAPRQVKANALVVSMEELLRRTLGEQIRLELVLAGGLWTTLCDPHQLESAVLNLVINARDAMPSGGQLTVETANTYLDETYVAQVEPGLTPGQYVSIAVSDTGTGMTPEVLVQAIEPFFTTKPLGQGSGLGLSMIYGFAKQSEGHLRIYSELGEGTSVKLYLPRCMRQEAEHISEQKVSLEQAHGETVLVVEDEPVVRNLVLEVLSELGYGAVEASDGPEAVQILQSDIRIDLLVTDIGLPGLNGREVAAQGRRVRPDLKILFMTGYAKNAAISKGFLEPGMAIISKPFAIEVLANRIRAMIQGG